MEYCRKFVPLTYGSGGQTTSSLTSTCGGKYIGFGGAKEERNNVMLCNYLQIYNKLLKLNKSIN